jgi:hypothetical protein
MANDNISDSKNKKKFESPLMKVVLVLIGFLLPVLLFQVRIPTTIVLISSATGLSTIVFLFCGEKIQNLLLSRRYIAIVYAGAAVVVLPIISGFQISWAQNNLAILTNGSGTHWLTTIAGMLMMLIGGLLEVFKGDGRNNMLLIILGMAIVFHGFGGWSVVFETQDIIPVNNRIIAGSYRDSEISSVDKALSLCSLESDQYADLSDDDLLKNGITRDILNGRERRIVALNRPVQPCARSLSYSPDRPLKLGFSSPNLVSVTPYSSTLLKRDVINVDVLDRASGVNSRIGIILGEGNRIALSQPPSLGLSDTEALIIWSELGASSLYAYAIIDSTERSNTNTTLLATSEQTGTLDFGGSDRILMVGEGEPYELSTQFEPENISVSNIVKLNSKWVVSGSATIKPFNEIGLLSPQEVGFAFLLNNEGTISTAIVNDKITTYTAGASNDYSAVIVGDQGHLLYLQEDGTLKSYSLETSNILVDIAYGNGVWVAVGLDGSSYSSIDLNSDWKNLSLATGESLFSISYNPENDSFVSVGENGIFARLSPANGSRWNINGLGNNTTQIESIKYVLGGYLLRTDDGHLRFKHE